VHRLQFQEKYLGLYSPNRFVLTFCLKFGVQAPSADSKGNHAVGADDAAESLHLAAAIAFADGAHTQVAQSEAPPTAANDFHRIPDMVLLSRRSLACSFAYSFCGGCCACSAVAGMISASSPSISWNCLEVTKPMLRPAFFVSKIQAIFSISRLLGRRLSS
jgi:hypothetical protein